MGLQLRIKLHPRSAIPQIDLLGIEIIDGILDSRTVVKTSDIVVTRNSSVGMDCWFLNVPVLFFVNGTLNGDNINYIPKDYLGVIQSEPKVEVLSQMLPSIIECFYEHPYHSEFFVDEELLNNEILA